MSQDAAWYGVDSVARGQFRTFSELGDSISMTVRDRRHALALSGEEWNAWTEFVADGALPTRPALPEMLIRLGVATSRLAHLAEARVDAQ